MSRQSPTGFAFGVIAEIAAVVFLVSLLPRVGWRPEASKPIPPSVADFIPAADAKSRLPVGPANIDPFDAIRVNDPSPPRYVEQRLDRASQELINSIGMHVANTTDNLLGPFRPATQLPASSSHSPSELSHNRRLWLRY